MAAKTEEKGRREFLRNRIPAGITRYQQFLNHNNHNTVNYDADDSSVMDNNYYLESITKSQINCFSTVYREKKEYVSNIKNSPMYSIIANKKTPYKLIISKEHVVDMVGKDAPGVGSYICDQ